MADTTVTVTENGACRHPCGCDTPSSNEHQAQHRVRHAPRLIRQQNAPREDARPRKRDTEQQ